MSGITGRVRLGAILEALDIERPKDCPYKNYEWIEFYDVDISEDYFDCEVCHGELPEPDHEVNSALLADFIEAVKTGDTMTAKALVGRVFEDRDDAAIAGGLL